MSNNRDLALKAFLVSFELGEVLPPSVVGLLEELAIALRESDSRVEAVREAVEYGSRMDVTPTRIVQGGGLESEMWWQSWHMRADAAWRANILSALGDDPYLARGGKPPTESERAEVRNLLRELGAFDVPRD